MGLETHASFLAEYVNPTQIVSISGLHVRPNEQPVLHARAVRKIKSSNFLAPQSSPLPFALISIPQVDFRQRGCVMPRGFRYGAPSCKRSIPAYFMTLSCHTTDPIVSHDQTS